MNGLVYLYDLRAPRVQGSSVNNLMMFQKLVGPKALDNVILAPTFWEKMLDTDIQRNIDELVQEKRFWGGMMKKGARVMKLSRDPACALKIIMAIAEKRPIILQAQEEMNNQKLAIDQTAARLIFDDFVMDDSAFNKTKQDLLRPLAKTATSDKPRFSPPKIAQVHDENFVHFEKYKAEHEEKLQQKRDMVLEVKRQTQALKERRERLQQTGHRSGDHSGRSGSMSHRSYSKSSTKCRHRIPTREFARCGECNRALLDVGNVF